MGVVKSLGARAALALGLLFLLNSANLLLGLAGPPAFAGAGPFEAAGSAVAVVLWPALFLGLWRRWR